MALKSDLTSRLEAIERRLLIGALAILLGSSILGAVLKWGIAWQMPLIIMTLLVILRTVIPVEEIHDDVKYLREVSGLSVQSYPTLSSYYLDLRHGVSEARHSLDLTHIRDNPPDDFLGVHPSEYFREVVAFAENDEGHYVRRIIAVRNDRMRAWAETLHQSTSLIPRYQVRVIEWATQAPAINLSIIDNKAVFLAVTGDSVERTRGLAVEDEKISSYFSDYFSTLWRESKPLAEFLSS
jgi:hypothetical protein